MTNQKVEQPVKKITEGAEQAARAESAPPHVRHYRALLFRGTLFIIAGAFGVLTFLVKTTPSFAIDLQITQAIQMIRSPVFNAAMIWLSWPGFTPQSMIIVVLVILFIWISGLHWEAVMALAAAVLSTGVNLLVKDLIHRPRPTAAQVTVIDLLKSYSFPSGHVMFYVGFFGFVAFLVFSLLKPSMKRTLILVFINLWIVLIGVSRISLGEHWASDVLGAYLLGSLTLVAIVQLYLWGKTRFFVNQPVAPATPEPTMPQKEPPPAVKDGE
ncbi:MAG TPA: phosphatase PAP2 family protein [Anaerolinea sp.]|nr:phosphatase PAP2 family protein [Anaerolinea sp.]